jgi:hypothetical protein
MLQQYNMEDNETIGMVYAPGKLRDGGRPSMPAKTGMWLRNFGSDNGLEGVVIGVEGDAIAVFIPGQGYNRPTGWLPQECEVSMKQVKPSW